MKLMLNDFEHPTKMGKKLYKIAMSVIKNSEYKIIEDNNNERIIHLGIYSSLAKVILENFFINIDLEKYSFEIHNLIPVKEQTYEINSSKSEFFIVFYEKTRKYKYNFAMRVEYTIINDKVKLFISTKINNVKKTIEVDNVYLPLIKNIHYRTLFNNGYVNAAKSKNFLLTKDQIPSYINKEDIEYNNNLIIVNENKYFIDDLYKNIKKYNSKIKLNRMTQMYNKNKTHINKKDYFYSIYSVDNIDIKKYLLGSIPSTFENNLNLKKFNMVDFKKLYWYGLDLYSDFYLSNIGYIDHIDGKILNIIKNDIWI